MPVRHCERDPRLGKSRIELQGPFCRGPYARLNFRRRHARVVWKEFKRICEPGMCAREIRILLSGSCEIICCQCNAATLEEIESAQIQIRSEEHTAQLQSLA